MSSEKKWWQGAIAYQVYLRSYQDSNGDGIGDLPGLIKRLDYIRDLGAQAIWLTPPYPSPMKDFGYDVEDYKQIDPQFGTLDDFRQLVTEAKERGIRIILDHVWSHSSDRHPWFIASADPAHPDHAKYRDYYVWSETPHEDGPPNNWQSVFNGSAWSWHDKRNAWYLHNFLEEQPDLNWHTDAVRQEIEDVARFWLELGAGGFRLDVCNFFVHDPELKDDPVSPAAKAKTDPLYWEMRHTQSINRPETRKFITQLRTNLAQDFPDAFFLGEVAFMEGGPAAAFQTYVDPGVCFDSVYSNYLVYDNYPTAQELRELLRQVKDEFRGDGAMYWVLGTHDFKRVATRWLKQRENNPDLLVQASALLLSLPGIAGFYQGDELGLRDGIVTAATMQDPQGIRYNDVTKSRDGCRTPVPWDSADSGPAIGFSTSDKTWLPMPESYRLRAANEQQADKNSILHRTANLIALSRRHAAWRHGALTEISVEQNILRFTRRNENESLSYVFNMSSQAAKISAPSDGLTAIWSQGATFKGSDIELQPHAALVYAL